MWILDEADQVVEGIGNCRDFDPLPYVLNRRNNRRTCGHEMPHGVLDVLDTPICDVATSPRSAESRIRIEAEFVTSDIEPHIERLVARYGVENTTLTVA